MAITINSDVEKMLICNSYNMGKRDLPDIYVQARGPQARGHTYILQILISHVISNIFHLGAYIHSMLNKSSKILNPQSLLYYICLVINTFVRRYIVERRYNPWHCPKMEYRCAQVWNV